MKGKLGLLLLPLLFISMFSVVPAFAGDGEYADTIIEAIDEQKAMKFQSSEDKEKESGSWWSNLKSSVSNGISNAWNGVKSGVSSVVQKTKETAKGFWGGLKSKVSSAWNGVKTVAKNTFDYAVDKVKSKASEWVAEGLSSAMEFLGGGETDVSGITDPNRFAVASGIADLIKYKFNVGGVSDEVEAEKQAALAELAELAKNPIELDRPIALVHGWNSSPEMWEGDGGMQDWLSRVFSNSDENIEYLDIRGPDNIKETGQIVKDQVEALKERTDSDKVDIITHSMGGLATRSAIQNYGMGDAGNVYNIASPLRGTEEGGIISAVNREGGLINKVATFAGQKFPSFGDWWNPLMGQGHDLDHDSEFIQNLDTPEGDKLYSDNVENVDNYSVDSDPVVSDMSSHPDFGENCTNHEAFRAGRDGWVSHSELPNDPRMVLAIVKQIQARQADRSE